MRWQQRCWACSDSIGRARMHGGGGIGRVALGKYERFDSWGTLDASHYFLEVSGRLLYFLDRGHVDSVVRKREHKTIQKRHILKHLVTAG